MQPPSPYADLQKLNRLKTILGIICLVAPTVIIILIISGWIIAGILGADLDEGKSLTGIVINLVVLAWVGLWLPGLITGTILLATRR